MLPTVSKGRSSSSVRHNPVLPQYLRRIVKWQQMDIEYTFWQMLHLCTSPKVVYQHTKYHKQTKNQWARDDPAFVVVCSLLLVVATSAYCVAYDRSVAHTVFTVISVLVFHFLITGVVLATCCWFLTNTYLREEVANSHVVEQRVEWLYAFDVHCNSFFPLFIILYVIHYFLSPLLVAHGFIPVLLSNLLFMVAVSYYHYLNFLGYDDPLNGWSDYKCSPHVAAAVSACIFLAYVAQVFVVSLSSFDESTFNEYSYYALGCFTVLPFLDKTTFFLYPIGLVIILTPLFILSGINPTRHVMSIYFGQKL